MPIHYGGCPCLIRELKQIAEDYNLLLIEDAAESLGAKIKNETVGTFGDAAMFSFCQNKIISTGEGGAISTNSNEIYEKLKLIRSHGRSETVDYFSSTYGGKRMSTVLPEEQRNVIRGKVIIEKDAFIGTNVVIHPNVTIGEGSIIGSNSLILKDVEPWTINVGSPCKKIGVRPKVNLEDL